MINGTGFLAGFDLEDLASLRLLARGILFCKDNGRIPQNHPFMRRMSRLQQSTVEEIARFMQDNTLLTDVVETFLRSSRGGDDQLLHGGRIMRDHANRSATIPGTPAYREVEEIWSCKVPRRLFLGNPRVQMVGYQEEAKEVNQDDTDMEDSVTPEKPKKRARKSKKADDGEDDEEYKPHPARASRSVLRSL